MLQSDFMKKMQDFAKLVKKTDGHVIKIGKNEDPMEAIDKFDQPIEDTTNQELRDGYNDLVGDINAGLDDDISKGKSKVQPKETAVPPEPEKDDPGSNKPPSTNKTEAPVTSSLTKPKQTRTRTPRATKPAGDLIGAALIDMYSHLTKNQVAELKPATLLQLALIGK